MSKRNILTLFLLIALVSCAGSAEETHINLNSSINNELSDTEELRGMDKQIEDYLQRWEMHGAALAIIKNDSLVYAKGYGQADDTTTMEPHYLMRVASVSKLITAVGIMHLVDEGLLKLSDKAFGPEGILRDSVYANAQCDPTHNLITVEHLLRHQGGFETDLMFSPETVRSCLGLDRQPEADDYIRYSLSRKVRYAPGTTNIYSNLGYLLLSRIIESVSGVSYETFIADSILAPIGIYDMHIAQNEHSARRAGEVHYYSHSEELDPYTSNDITVLAGAGAWCTSVVELAKLIAAIDGRPEQPDILSKEAIDAMVAYSDPELFSLGWNDTNPENGWTRTGSFAGTSALIHYFPDGECWIMVTNSSTWRGFRQTRYTTELFHELRAAYSEHLPHKDLFKGPLPCRR